MIVEFFQNFADISRWWLVPIWLFCARLGAVPFWKEMDKHPDRVASGTGWRVGVWVFIGLIMFVFQLKPGGGVETVPVILAFWFKCMLALGILQILPNVIENNYVINFFKVVFLWDFSVFNKNKKVETQTSLTNNHIIEQYEKNIKKDSVLESIHRS
jgi:hypothetical protein